MAATVRRRSRRRLVAMRAALTGIVAGAAVFAASASARQSAQRVVRGVLRSGTAAATITAAAADWTTYGGGLGNTFANAQASIGATATPLWTAAADGEVSGNPVAVGQTVYFTTLAGSVYAVSRATGQLLWHRALDGSPINAGPLYDNGHLFVATSGGRIFSLDPSDGTTLWSTGVLFGSLKDALRASPRAYNGVIYQSLGGTDDDLNEQGGVVAIDEARGTVLWQTMLVDYAGGGSAVFSPPAILASLGELVVATGNPTPYPTNDDTAALGPVPAGNDPYSDSLVALSLTDGHVIWSSQTVGHDGGDADFLAAPNVIPLAGGGWAVGAGEKNGTYYAFNAVTGAPLWHTSLSMSRGTTLIVATSAVANGRIFVGTMDVPAGASWPSDYQAPAVGRLVALDAGTGKILWTDQLGSALDAAPVASNTGVLAVEANGTLVAVGASNGNIMRSVATGGQIWNAEAALSLLPGAVLLPLTNPPASSASTARPTGAVAAYAVS